jgi:hypothetical protein
MDMKMFRISNDRALRVVDYAHFLARKRGYKVTREAALAEMIDFCLAHHSFQSTQSTEQNRTEASDDRAN